MDGAGQSNYDERVAAGWRAFFRTLPEGARILDLCTGNGAVAIIAAEVSALHGKRFDITGIDLADIDPKRFVSRYGGIANEVTFVRKTSCERLPYADGGFDAIVSQFGVEYSDLDESLAEAARVMAPCARLRLFLHAREGTVVAQTKKAIADADFLLDKAKLCDRAAQCFRAVAAVERGDDSVEAVARADRYFATFQSSLESVTRHLKRATDQAMIRNATAVLLHAYDHRHQVPTDALVAKAAELKDEIVAHRSRQRALVRAAVNKSRMEKLAAALAGMGMIDVTWHEARPGAEFLGYVVEATRTLPVRRTVDAAQPA